MDVVDAEHKKSLYRDERIILVDTQTKALIRGKPGWWQMMMGGFLFSNRIARSVKGTLYLTNRRILFIRELLKEDIEPKSTKERIQLRKDREPIGSADRVEVSERAPAQASSEGAGPRPEP